MQRPCCCKSGFGGGGTPESSGTEPADEEKAAAAEASASQGERENTPLTFALKNLDAEHPYLAEQNLTPETIKEFGLGYGVKGIMKGRIAIPIHNERGELVAYAGRWPGEEGFPEGEGTYKLPPDFHPELVLFNLHRAREYAHEEGELIVVKEFFECMWLWQAGVKNVVARMGSSLSPEQEALIVQTVGQQGRVLLLYGENDAGEECRDDELIQLARHVYVKSVNWQKKA